eukprot:COSAG06_NODE_10932_length_1594_cov_1.626087_1_plen_120_part_00
MYILTNPYRRQMQQRHGVDRRPVLRLHLALPARLLVRRGGALPRLLLRLLLVRRGALRDDRREGQARPGQYFTERQLASSSLLMRCTLRLAHAARTALLSSIGCSHVSLLLLAIDHRAA